MITPEKTLGFNGEKAAAEWLASHSFTIRELNYSTRYGEVDIIAQKDELVVMVEVKTRKTRYFSLSQLVNRYKQKKIIRAAQGYRLVHHLFDHVIRFDVAIVIPYDDEFVVEYIENAFQSGTW